MYRRHLLYCEDDCGVPASSPSPFTPLISLPPLPPPSSSVNRLMLSKSLSAIVSLLSAAFLLGVFYVTVARWYRRRNSSRRAMHMQPPPPALDRFLEDPEQINYVWYINTVGLDETLINSIAKCRYKKGEGLIEEKDCAVCLSEFQEGDDLRILPKCSHAFHLECVDKWLRAHVNCPLCRAPVSNNCSNFVPVESNDAASSIVGEPPVLDIESNGVQGGSASEAIGDEDHQREMLAIDYCVGQSSRDSHTGEREEGSPSIFQPIRRSVSMDSLARIRASMSFGTNSSREFSSVPSRGMAAIGPGSCQKSIPGKISGLRVGNHENLEEKSELQEPGDVDKQGRPRDMKRAFSIGSNFFFSMPGHYRRSVLPL